MHPRTYSNTTYVCRLVVCETSKLVCMTCYRDTLRMSYHKRCIHHSRWNGLYVRLDTSFCMGHSDRSWGILDDRSSKSWQKLPGEWLVQSPEKPETIGPFSVSFVCFVEIPCRKSFAGWSGLEVIIVSSAGCVEIALSGLFYLNGEEDGCNNNKRLDHFVLLCLSINIV